jgi:hypothetical protein
MESEIRVKLDQFYLLQVPTSTQICSRERQTKTRVREIDWMFNSQRETYKMTEWLRDNTDRDKNMTD